MAVKSFHIEDLLSVYTHILLSKSGFDAVYVFLNHMTQDDLFTHQLLLAGPIMEPELLRQFPWLDEVKVPEFTGKESVFAFVDKMAAKYGEFHEVESAEHLWVGHDGMSDMLQVLKGRDAQ